MKHCVQTGLFHDFISVPQNLRPLLKLFAVRNTVQTAEQNTDNESINTRTTHEDNRCAYVIGTVTDDKIRQDRINIS